MADVAKGGATKSPDKSNTSQKHSRIFYISTALFDNKRLKRKRLKLSAPQVKTKQSKPLQQKKSKTDKVKNKCTYNLNADVTINLVSDDDDNDCHKNDYKSKTEHTFDTTQHINNMQPLYVYTGPPMEVSQIPNITLVPVEKMLQIQTIPQKNTKRKRKAQQPKRHCQPQVVNNESIVLSDDDDAEFSNIAPHLNGQRIPESTIISPITKPQVIPNCMPLNSVQVDEEVTVSLVPRSSAAGTCKKRTTNNNDSPFPMLPDETTVQTVISNRTYELSLTKLREGLASCGIPEFNEYYANMSPTQRRKCKANMRSAAVVTPPQAPISLKLSSDLSISLISDDDEEEQTRQLLHAEKILQQHPQLSVQHLHFPPAAMTVVPRRDKIG